MASFDYFVGTFQMNSAANAESTYSGLPFQPKGLVFFHGASSLLDFDYSGFWGGFGVTDGENQFGTGHHSQGAVGTTNTGHIMGPHVFIGIRGDTFSPNVGVDKVTDFLNFTADGFRVRNTNDSGGARFSNFLAFGGCNCETRAGVLTLDTIQTNQVVDLPFTPDFVLFWSAYAGQTLSTVSFNDIASPGNLQGFGVSDGANEYSCSIFRQDNVAYNAANSRGGVESLSTAVQVIDLTGAVYASADVDRIHNGFRLNKLVMPAADTDIIYLAVKGARTNIGAFNASAGAGGTDAVTGVGFEPTAIMFFSDYLPGSCTAAGCNRLEFGGQATEGLGSTELGAVSWNGQDSNGPVGTQVNDYTYLSNSYAYVVTEGAFVTGTGSGVSAQLRVQTYDADGFTVHNNRRDAGVFLGAQEVSFLAMQPGSNPGPCDRAAKCESSLKYLTGLYGICGSAEDPELWTIHDACKKISGGATTLHRTLIDLGDNYICDFDIADLLIIRGLRGWLELTSPITVKVQASDDPGFATFEQESFSVALADLTGTGYQDWGTELTFTTMRRYWRLQIETSTAVNPALLSIALGKSVTFSRGPSFPVRTEVLDQFGEAEKYPLAWRLELERIYASEKERYDRLIRDIADVSPIWIWDGGDNILQGQRIAKAYLVDERVEMVRGDIFNIRMELEEIPVAGP